MISQMHFRLKPRKTKQNEHLNTSLVKCKKKKRNDSNQVLSMFMIMITGCNPIKEIKSLKRLN